MKVNVALCEYSQVIQAFGAEIWRFLPNLKTVVIGIKCFDFVGYDSY